MSIRVSIGSAIALGLVDRGLDAPMTTYYFMLDGSCQMNCAFCAQRRGAPAGKLSRIPWPSFDLSTIDRALKGRQERKCVQTLSYPGMMAKLLEAVRILRLSNGPISVCCHPLPAHEMRTLKKAGVSNLCIPLDAATPTIFELVRGKSVGNPYRWKKSWKGLKDAVKIFGSYNVTSHVIVGLGESDEEIVELNQRLWDMGVVPALFALWDRQPPLNRYRAIQLARYLIVHGLTDVKEMGFDGAKKLKKVAYLKKYPEDVRDAFKTSGCEGCNRPFYNERPMGPWYNYPRDLTTKEFEEAIDQVEGYLKE